jgi:threonine dehydrogenase-like Zn-dependent dehydrogenase
VAKVLGFAPVIGIEPHAGRRTLAQQVADHVLDVAEWNAAARRDLLGEGAALVLECSGQADLSTLCASARPGGVVVTLARTGRHPEIPLDEMITRGATCDRLDGKRTAGSHAVPHPAVEGTR